MGKGDKKTRRGKIFTGSYGKHRPRKAKGIVPVITVKDDTVKENVKVEKAESIEKKPLELQAEKKPEVLITEKKPKEVEAEKKPNKVKTERKKTETKETKKTKAEPKKTSKKKITKKKPCKEN